MRDVAIAHHRGPDRRVPWLTIPSLTVRGITLTPHTRTHPTHANTSFPHLHLRTHAQVTGAEGVNTSSTTAPGSPFIVRYRVVDTLGRAASAQV